MQANSSLLHPVTDTMPFLVISVIKVLTVFTVVMVIVALLTLMERKVSAWMQDRLGPNRVGPGGIGQPLADGIKNILKEETNPARANAVFFTLAPMLSIDEPEAALDEARMQALQVAQRRAETYARQLGKRVGRILSVSESGGGCFRSRKVPCLRRTSACDEPDSSRQNRNVAVALPSRRSRTITSGSQAGSTGSTTSVRRGATG